MIDIGTYARYPKTGTVGTVIRIQEHHGKTFGELDSTGLLYRIDQLIPAIKEKQTTFESRDSDLERVVKERNAVTEIDFNDAAFQQDGACHGGG